MTTLLNTLFAEKGELITIGQGRRILFAYCNNPTPRPIVIEVGETIERLYAEWARKNL